jgi:peroxiredoxin
LTGWQDELAINYCHLAVVSVDAPPVCGAMRAGLGASFTFLSDQKRQAITSLGIVDRSDPNHPRIAYPYSFALGPDLAIHKIYDGGWFVGRPTIEELRQDLRAMMQVYHPD